MKSSKSFFPAFLRFFLLSGHRLWFAALLLGALTACEFINPEEDTPAYLYIEPFELRPGPASQGSSRHLITEAWLTVGGEFLGAYSLPAILPVLKTGRQDITVQAGIRDNGVSATPEIYPFFSLYETSVDLEPGQIDTLRPVTSYSPRTQFAFIDDFESGGPLLQDLRVGNSENQLRIVEQGVFEGRGSGRIQLSSRSPSVELATTARFRNLTANSPQVYLELHYRSDVPVLVGISGYGGAANGVNLFEAGFRPRQEWTKIYFNLSTLLAQGKFDQVAIVFQASLTNTNGTAPLQEGSIWLDNVKLVHF